MAKYRLLYNEAAVDYSSDEITEIGKIVDNETGKDVMYITYEKALFRNVGYHICIFTHELNGVEYPVAYVDDLYKNHLYEHPSIFFTLMMHEYGHYINGDLEADMEHEEIREERVRCAQEGCVMDVELKADAFAISQVGKNAFMRAMDFLIQQRKKRNDQGMTLAIKEFENRKKAARKIRQR